MSISVGLLSYLLWIIDWDQAIKTLEQANKLLLLTAPFFLLAGYVISSSRWLLVLADSKVNFSFRQAYTGYLLGAFYSLFLPGVMGGDAVRIALCSKTTGGDLGTAVTSVMLERTAGVFALLSFLSFVCLLFPESLASAVPIKSTSIVIMLVAIMVTAMTVVVLGRRVLVMRHGEKSTRGISTFINSGIRALVSLRGRTLGLVLLLSALFQATDIIATFLLARAIGLTLSLKVFFAVLPLVYLATVIPISLGGLGVREGTLVLLLAHFNVRSLDAVTLSFLIYLNRVLIGGLGGLVQLAETSKVRAMQQSTEE
jgi:uncharacterized protein (TIRG00374 family)